MKKGTILCPICGSPTTIVNHFNSWDNYVCIKYGFGCSYYAAVDKKKREFLDQQEPIICKVTLNKGDM